MFKYRCRQCKEKHPYRETVRPWGICLECYHKARAKQKENLQRGAEGILEPTVDILLIDYVMPLAGSSRMIDADEADRMLTERLRYTPLKGLGGAIPNPMDALSPDYTPPTYCERCGRALSCPTDKWIAFPRSARRMTVVLDIPPTGVCTGHKE